MGVFGNALASLNPSLQLLILKSGSAKESKTFGELLFFS